MPNDLRLLCVFAHPDDESLGTGGLLARYAAESVAVSLVCATRGERGWGGPPEQDPGLAALGRIREAELLQAAQVLGLREVSFLDYLDGDVDRADPAEAVARITGHLRRLRPQVVVTFDPFGGYGHPDHIAVTQFTQAALLCAADPAYPGSALPPHAVDKLYYMVDSERMVEEVKRLLGGIRFDVDGVTRYHFGWPDWAITTRVDAAAYWRTALRAIECHASQVADFNLQALPEETHLLLWGQPTLYRAHSLVNGGRRIETDLFEGLR